MATIIDSLLISIGLDASKLQQGINEASKTMQGIDQSAIGAKESLQDTANVANETSSSFSNLVAIASKAVTIFASFKALKGMFNDYLASADIGYFSDQVRENAADVQAWGESIKSVGGDANTFNNTLSNLSKGLENAAVSGDISGVQALTWFGVSMTNADGSARKATDTLMDLADAFQGLSLAEIKSRSAGLGLDDATIRLLQKGRSAVTDLVAAQQQVFTQEDIDAAQELKQNFVTLTQSIRSISAMFMRNFIPVVKIATKALVSITTWMSNNKRFINTFFIGLAAVIGSVLIPMLAKLAIANAAAFLPFILIGGAIAGIAALIAGLIDDFQTFSEGGQSLFGDLWLSITPIISQVKTLWQSFKPIGSVLASIAKTIAKLSFNALIFAIKAVIANFNNMISIVLKVKDIVTSVFDGFTSVISTVKDALFGLIDMFANFFSGTVDKIGDFFDSFGDFFGFGSDTPKATASDAIPQSQIKAQKQQSNVTTDINSIVINTQATDAKGISKDLSDELARRQKDALNIYNIDGLVF